MENLNLLEEKIEYTFKDKDYLVEALTHSSYANEKHNGIVCNERLEFLGDAVLGIVSADYLFKKFPEMPEGELSKLRASLVCEQSLSQFAKEIDLGTFLLLGKGEVNTGGRERPSILEDAFESLIAAIYLDGGMDAAKKHILRFIEAHLNKQPQNFNKFKDYKTMLQEVIQQNPDESVNYVVVGESGPDHNKKFDVEVHLNSNVIGKGSGRSKKQAEQAAAKEALSLMGI